MRVNGKKLKGLAKPAISSVILTASVVLQLLESSGLSDAAAGSVASAYTAVEALQAVLDEPVPGGRGLSLHPRLPTLDTAKSRMYEDLIGTPDRFEALCGWTPDEFRDLLADVRDVFLKPRDTYGLYTEDENMSRRRRKFKHSPAERLLAFLVYLRTYPPLRKFNVYWGLCPMALWEDIKWLREQLVQHPALAAEIAWPSAAERAETRRMLTRCGALPPGFENAVAIADGTKDWADQAAFDKDNIRNKGYGKTHMLLPDLFGKPIYCEAGLDGNRNDRGLWKTTAIYRHPQRYLCGDENILMDGVFQGNLHAETDGGAIIPANAPLMATADAAVQRQLRASNRKQRYLRAVIEQTNGMIKQYKIVGNVAYRADVEEQGLNWTLCTQLTARTMRVRDKYPRGQKFIDQAGDLEDWEQALQMMNRLYVDQQQPGLYV